MRMPPSMPVPVCHTVPMCPTLHTRGFLCHTWRDGRADFKVGKSNVFARYYAPSRPRSRRGGGRGRGTGRQMRAHVTRLYASERTSRAISPIIASRFSRYTSHSCFGFALYPGYGFNQESNTPFYSANITSTSMADAFLPSCTDLALASATSPDSLTLSANAKPLASL